MAARDVDRPGLGADHKDGYEVNPERLKGIGKELVTAFDDVYDKLLKPMHSGDAMQPSESWQAARTAVYIMSTSSASPMCTPR
jgi:hypothetical protein